MVTESKPSNPIASTEGVVSEVHGAPFDGEVPTKSGMTTDDLMEELRPRIREIKNSWSLIRGNWTAMMGLMLISFVVGVALLAPILSPVAPFADPLRLPMDFGTPVPPFTPGHPLGTGEDGADLWHGLVWGARITITTSLYVVLTAALIGLVLGAVSGYYGGKVDEVIMRLTDIFLSLPALILAMAVAAVLPRTMENMMFALVLVWWPAYARLIRGQVLSVRENTYVEAARAIGAKKGRILFKHIVPNSISPLVVSITMDLGAVALTAAALSFIGFGVESGYAEWGRMASDGQKWMFALVEYEGIKYTAWWVATIPSLAIFIFTMGFTLIGDGLRDILDPRLRRS
jgi:peptide/nickel transport system permease protein